MRNTALKCIAFSLCKINVPIYLQKGYMDKIKELALELADFLKFDVLRQSLPKTDRFSLDRLNLDFEI